MLYIVVKSVWVSERGWFISDKVIKEMNLL